MAFVSPSLPVIILNVNGLNTLMKRYKLIEWILKKQDSATVSPLCTKVFCSETAFVSPICKSSKVSLRIQLIQLTI